MTVPQTVVAILVVTAGSVVQGSVGFGLGILAAPVLLLIEPTLVPGPLLLAALVLTLLLAGREWRAIRFRDLGWSLPGRVVGTAAAATLLKVMPAERVGLAVAVLILASVALSATGLHLDPKPPALLGAGALAGLLGAATSTGGPPIAMLYQRENGPSARGTLSAFFVVGVVISLTGLAAVGRFGMAEVRLTGGLLPGVLIGFLVSRRTARLLDRGYTRPTILALSALAGLIAIVDQLR